MEIRSSAKYPFTLFRKRQWYSLTSHLLPLTSKSLLTSNS